MKVSILNKNINKYCNKVNNSFTSRADNGFISNKGLSLTEIIISFAIFVMAVVPFVNILMYSTKANVKSLGAIKATTLALSMCEQLKYGSSFVEVPPFPKKVFTGYFSLQQLIIEASPGVEGTNYNEYTKSFDYGSIAGYPKHKIDIAVAYYPVKTFKKIKFPQMVFDSAAPPPPVTNPKERPEYEKMLSRIQVNITVKWLEADNPKEHEFKVFTIVTKP